MTRARSVRRRDFRGSFHAEPGMPFPGAQCPTWFVQAILRLSLMIAGAHGCLPEVSCRFGKLLLFACDHGVCERAITGDSLHGFRAQRRRSCRCGDP